MLKNTAKLPFILITALFALWGFANDITNPMVSAFKTVLQMSNFRASLVQLAFYGGYFTMAIPAALFIRKYSYKTGIMIGLGLYALGALLFYPAAKYQAFEFFLMALYILTFGLAFLETTANPYILAMGDEKSATQRLNFAQSFNPIGSLTGMFIAQKYILEKLNSDDTDAAGNSLFTSLAETEQAVVRTHDLEIIRNPYLYLGIFVLLYFVIIALYKMPKITKTEKSLEPAKFVFARLLKNKNYVWSVIAQAFYVGAQIMCWTFIIQYAERLGLSKADAQSYNIVAMVTFLFSRIICTFLLRYIEGSKLLFFFACGAVLSTTGVIFIDGMTGLYFLVATSFFMSLMFPTIYGIGLEGLGEDAKLGSAGLVMAIVGGALMPPLQGALIDMGGVGSLSGENFSFVLPFICFVVIAYYAFTVNTKKEITA
ncbi:L-fucose:H+ symporter permease [Lacihabitans lacunae]|uniref:L-fucose:H+ symporter permease n=1 Tax=Lacihabitans lacunae TaxID=1028214 RepID=A0ABV7YWS4_9BACT